MKKVIILLLVSTFFVFCETKHYTGIVNSNQKKNIVSFRNRGKLFVFLDSFSNSIKRNENLKSYFSENAWAKFNNLNHNTLDSLSHYIDREMFYFDRKGSSFVVSFGFENKITGTSFGYYYIDFHKNNNGIIQNIKFGK
jgi:hypothetical protein